MRYTTILSIVVAVLLSGGASLAQTVGYAYDAAGRLTHAYYPDGAIQYVYDPAGNLLSRIVTAGTSPAPIEPSLNALRVGADLVLTYSTAACVSADHALFSGNLGGFGSVVTAECSIGSGGSVTLPLPPGPAWFLIAGVEGDRYSSVGSTGAGERALTGVEAICPSFTADTTRSCP